MTTRQGRARTTVAEDKVFASLRQQARAGLPCPTNATFQRLLKVNSRSTVPKILSRLSDLEMIALEIVGNRRRVRVRDHDGAELVTGWGSYRITGTASAFRRQHASVDGFGDTAIEPDVQKSANVATRMPSVVQTLHNRKEIGDPGLDACEMFEGFYARARLDPLRAQNYETGGGGGGARSFDGVPASISSARAHIRRCLNDCFPAEAGGTVSQEMMDARRVAEMIVGGGESIKSFCETSAQITGRPIHRREVMRLVRLVVDEMTRFYGTSLEGERGHRRARQLEREGAKARMRS